MFEKEQITNDSDEYQRVLTFLDLTLSHYAKSHNITFREIAGPNTALNIYKIIKKKAVATKATNNINKNETKHSLWLLHGTDEIAVGGILQEGFKDSNKGTFGKGVYLTDCSSIAYSYALGKVKPKSADWKEKVYIFIVEVINAEKLVCMNYNENDNGLSKDTINKHVTKFTTGQLKLSGYGIRSYDTQLIKHRTKVHDPKSTLDIFVAKPSVTIPKYLIAINNFLKP